MAASQLLKKVLVRYHKDSDCSTDVLQTIDILLDTAAPEPRASEAIEFDYVVLPFAEVADDEVLRLLFRIPSSLSSEARALWCLYCVY